MALLGSGTLANMGTAFYLRENVPVVGPVIAPSFQAIGTAPAFAGEVLIRAQDLAGVGIGSSALVLATDNGDQRMTVGLLGADVGGNTGSDLAITGYTDDSVTATTGLIVRRITGEAVLPSGGSVGLAGTVGGGIFNVNGTLGAGRVYDAVYNPPPAGLAPQLAPIVSLVSPLFYGLQPAGSNLTNIGTFTVPKTGVYLFTSTFTCNVASDAAGLDSSCIIGASDAVGMDIAGVPGVNFFQNMKPWSMPSTTAVLPGIDYIIKSTMSAVLSVGQTYTVYAATENISGTMKFPDNGGPGFGNSSFNFDLVALC